MIRTNATGMEKTGKGKGTGAAPGPKKIQREFQLKQEEWPYPIANFEDDLTNIKPDADGIFMVGNEALAQRAAYAMAGAKKLGSLWWHPKSGRLAN